MPLASCNFESNTSSSIDNNESQVPNIPSNPSTDEGNDNQTGSGSNNNNGDNSTTGPVIDGDNNGGNNNSSSNDNQNSNSNNNGNNSTTGPVIDGDNNGDNNNSSSNDNQNSGSNNNENEYPNNGIEPDVVSNSVELEKIYSNTKYGNVPLPQVPDEQITDQNIYDMFTSIIESYEKVDYFFGERNIDSTRVATIFAKWLTEKWSSYPYLLMNNDALMLISKDVDNPNSNYRKINNTYENINNKSWYMYKIKSVLDYADDWMFENEYRDTIQRILDEVASLIKPGMNEWDKFSVIYNYVINYVWYSGEGQGRGSPWQLYHHHGVCADYGNLTALLLNTFGIKALPMITGLQDAASLHEIVWSYLPNPNKDQYPNSPDYLWYLSDPTFGDQTSSDFFGSGGIQSYTKITTQTAEYASGNLINEDQFKETGMHRNSNIFYQAPFGSPFWQYYDNATSEQKRLSEIIGQASFGKYTGPRPGTIFDKRGGKDKQYDFSTPYFWNGRWISLRAKVINSTTVTNIELYDEDKNITINDRWDEEFGINDTQKNAIIKSATSSTLTFTNKPNMIIYKDTAIFPYYRSVDDSGFIFANKNANKVIEFKLTLNEMKQYLYDNGIINKSDTIQYFKLSSFAFLDGNFTYNVCYDQNYAPKSTPEIKVDLPKEIWDLLNTEKINSTTILNKISVNRTMSGLYKTDDSKQKSYSQTKQEKENYWSFLDQMKQKYLTNPNYSQDVLNNDFETLKNKKSEYDNNAIYAGKTIFMRDRNDDEYTITKTNLEKYGFNLRRFLILGEKEDILTSSNYARYDVLKKSPSTNNQWKKIIKNHGFDNLALKVQDIEEGAEFKIKMYPSKTENLFYETNPFKISVVDDNGIELPKNGNLRLGIWPEYGAVTSYNSETNYANSTKTTRWDEVPIVIENYFNNPNYINFDLEYELHYINPENLHDKIVHTQSVGSLTNKIVYNIGLPSNENHGIYYSVLKYKNKLTQETGESYSTSFYVTTKDDINNFSPIVWRKMTNIMFGKNENY